MPGLRVLSLCLLHSTSTCSHEVISIFGYLIGWFVSIHVFVCAMNFNLDVAQIFIFLIALLLIIIIKNLSFLEQRFQLGVLTKLT